MSKILFNEHQRRLLEANPNMNSVSDRSIQYKPEFKVLAVKENQSGKGSPGRPSTEGLSPEKKLEKAEARIKYLEAEVELLKKLEELER
ncbi:hypothetical protein [Sporosarcina sp. FA15]|uniref:hypothetical protein n=1 Tax=Sporosarcina sp. FA15 TaxID=3413031 RepID=UPI003F657C55